MHRHQPHSESFSIRYFFENNNQLTKEQFIIAIRNWWKQTILKEYPNQCESAAADKVAEQSWNNYVKACDFFDKNRVVEGCIKHTSSSLSDDLDRMYLENSYRYDTLGTRESLCIERNRNKKKLLPLSPEDEAKIKTIINMPDYLWQHDSEPLISSTVNSNTHLINQLGSTNYENTMSLIELGADVNQYSAKHGNTALLLAVSKGWNHQDSENFVPNVFSRFYPQRKIIISLLEHKADVNAIHLVNGMTALHIACLRGDDPELIVLLFNNRANLNAKDYEGRTPLDLLNLDYESAQKIIIQMTVLSEIGWKEWNFGYKLPENKSITATLPTRKHRRENQKEIRELLAFMQNISSKNPSSRLGL